MAITVVIADVIVWSWCGCVQRVVCVVGRLGYQFGLSDNFVMDLGMGLVVLSDFHKYKRYLPDAELRLMTGIGYRF